MSDAMTNREIEDVLTSIRRLVAQDGLRATERPAVAVPIAAARPAERLILTEAHRIDAAPSAEAPGDPAQPEVPSVKAPEATPVTSGFDAASLPSPDFGRLEATIAELEAAVSASGGTWEGEVAEDAPRASNVTDLYGRLHLGPRRDSVQDLSDPAADPVPVPPSTDTATPDLPIAPPAAEAAAAPPAADEGEAVFRLPPAQTAPDTDPPPAHDATEPGEAILDEAALYALVAQIVREELHGQLGERITAQVRKLVRAEIAKALDDRKFL